MAKYLADTTKPIINNVQKLRVAIVYSEFNSAITLKMLKACQTHLRALGVLPENMFCEKVIGALEIPLALSWCRKYYAADSLIAIGCVIRGDTYHFEIVSNTSATALSNLSMSSNCAVVNGIITCENVSQARARIAPVALHIANSAVEFAMLKDHLKETVKTKNKIQKVTKKIIK